MGNKIQKENDFESLKTCVKEFMKESNIKNNFDSSTNYYNYNNDTANPSSTFSLKKSKINLIDHMSNMNNVDFSLDICSQLINFNYNTIVNTDIYTECFLGSEFKLKNDLKLKKANDIYKIKDKKSERKKFNLFLCKKHLFYF